MNSEVEAYGAAVARRFRTNVATTFFAKTISKDPIAISMLNLAAPTGRWTETPDPEAAFSVHVVMAPLPRLQTWIEGRHAKLDPLKAGDICLFDLSTSPISLIQDPLDTVRLHFSQRTLDDLAYDRGQRSSSLRATFGAHDPALHGLSSALLSRLRLYGGSDPLFLDHVALAFHIHLAQTYGELRGEQPLRGGLAPWQLRRARELMLAKLSEGVGLAELAGECGLSASYFARAFRHSVGVTAHRWLMNERVERAKDLLRYSALPVAEIAVACGFTDQSHFTRAFAFREGHPPARWRRLHLD